jgi:hypothetical protein
LNQDTDERVFHDGFEKRKTVAISCRDPSSGGGSLFAAYPIKPRAPLRIMFKIAGNVLFDHKEHTWDKGSA